MAACLAATGGALNAIRQPDKCWTHCLEDDEMKRPKQLPAVDRNSSGKTAAVPAGANVSPSGWLDTVLSAAPGIIGALGGL